MVIRTAGLRQEKPGTSRTSRAVGYALLKRRLAIKALIIWIAFAGLEASQIPTGTIRGTVRDPASLVVPGASVDLVSTQTGLSWPRATTDPGGGYSFPGLPPGEYEVTITAAGFPSLLSHVKVAPGTTTQSDISLRLGEIARVVDVGGASPQMRYDSNVVGGSITRDQMENIPTNGRNFQDLAKLQAGMQAAVPGSLGRIFVPSLGAPGGNSGRGTRTTIDGGSIMAVGAGGSAMGFSQDAVQEFHASTVNFDFSTGATVSGSINAVTRSGGSSFNGEAFGYLRDHKLAAYPALARDPTNPDPFFQRRQFGVAMGGPIIRSRAFFFGAWERNEQRAVATTTLADPDFSHLSRITASPLFGNRASIRIDAPLSAMHKAFIRYSHDGITSFGPVPLRPNAYPSNWPRQNGWTDQSVLSVTSVLPDLVNEFHFSYFYNSSKQEPPGEEDCVGCLGMNQPMISIPQSRLILGDFGKTYAVGRRFQWSDTVTWQIAAHSFRFGFNWEHNRGGRLVWSNEPASISLFSPQQARQAGKSHPPVFDTVANILALPLQTTVVSVGDPRVPQGGLTRNWDTAYVSFQDRWLSRPGLSLTYGLGWSMDHNLNHDLTKPKLLAPILGESGLGRTRKQWSNLSPVAGFVWSPLPSRSTVVRGGAGLFYDFFFLNPEPERAALGPPRLGRQTFQGSAILNPIEGIPDAPSGTPLDFRRPTSFTGTHLMTILPAIRTDLIQDIENADQSLQQIQISKTMGDGGLNPVDVPASSALHANFGLQQRIAEDLVISIDLAYKRLRHVGLGAVDANRFRSTSGPLIPKCLVEERNDPDAICSNGQVLLNAPVGRSTYKGLLVRAEQRFSRRLQFVASWAYSSNAGTSDTTSNGFNLYDWQANHGPLPTDIPHIFNLAGSVKAPWRLSIGLNFSYLSAPPFSAFVGGADFNGDGSAGDLLPGSTVNVFNRGMHREDLTRLVAEFNETYAGRTDAGSVNLIPVLSLPANYEFADSSHALDLRLSRSFPLAERGTVTLIADVFNLYNAANLSGYSGDLTNSSTFGRPTTRSDQAFGSGGPRAFQLAVKVSF